MATKLQRARSVLDALADATVSNELATRIADAFASAYAGGLTLTNEQKAGVFLFHLRRILKEVVRTQEVFVAAETARKQAEANDIPLGTDGAPG